MKTITRKDLFNHVKAHYYTDEEQDLLWYPFEDFTDGEIKIWIDDDVEALKDFLISKGFKIKEN